jgi:hypothetical protein
VASLDGVGGTQASLASSASTVLQDVVPTGTSPQGVTVTITDAQGVSRYVGGSGGVIYAYRTAGKIALETVSIDGGVTSDSVRLQDGSGTTTIDGSAIDGTVFQLTRSSDGVETAEISSDDGDFNDSSAPANLSASDAFGDTVSVVGHRDGAPTITMTDPFGDTFTYATNDGNDGTLTAGITVGGASGTAKADVVAQETATLTTGSIARAATALEADRTSTKAGGKLDVALGDTVDSDATTDPLDGLTTTAAQAELSITGTASGTLDVLGGAQGSVLDGAEAENGDELGGGNAEQGEGARVFEGASPHTIVNVSVQAQATDQRTPTSPKDSATSDLGEISVSAFGRTSFGTADEEIDRADDQVYTSTISGMLLL